MFCKNCGEQLADNAKFCLSCGTATKLHSAVASSAEQRSARRPSGSSYEAASVTREKAKPKPLVIGVAALAAVVVLIGVVFFVVNSLPVDDKIVGKWYTSKIDLEGEVTELDYDPAHYVYFFEDGTYNRSDDGDRGTWRVGNQGSRTLVVAVSNVRSFNDTTYIYDRMANQLITEGVDLYVYFSKV